MIYRFKTADKKELSFLGLGCWRFGEKERPEPSLNPGRNYWNGQDRRNSIRTIDFAAASGITHYDTAQAYGLGLSEQLTGQRLRKIRDRVIIATKIIPSSNSMDNTMKKILLSLRRLNTGYIDILYLHWPDKRYDIRYAVETLEAARRKGLVRHTGVSNFTVENMQTATDAGKIDFCQTGYSLIWKHREKDIIPFCTENGISVIAYSFYAQGILLKKEFHKRREILDSWRKNLVFMDSKNRDIVLSIINELENISRESGYSIPCLLLNWGLSKNWLTGVLAGASSREQLMQSAAAFETPPERFIIEKLDNLSIISDNITDTHNIFSHVM